MMNKLLSFFAISVVIVSCRSKHEHKPQMGSVDNIIPQPQLVEVFPDQIGFYSDGTLVVSGSDFMSNSWDLAKDWFENAGLHIYQSDSDKSQLLFTLSDEIKGDETYSLKVAEDQIQISASTPKGLYRGWTTLRLMIPVTAESGGCSNGFYLPVVSIDDFPDFEHRGLLLDCCRHFMEPDFVKKMIDNLSIHKMNVLHWHLTEDQGWRVEIDSYPRLTEVGAWRTETDGSTYGGFYSKETIKEIIEYAVARHVEIIPEIEVPGHSQAALASYPWLGCTGEEMLVANKWGVFKDIYCPGNDSTLRFLESVFDEVCELFPSTKIHIGGDEAPKVRWASCDKCQKRIKDEGLADENELQTWVIEHVGEYLAYKGKTIIGWDEILEGGLPEGAAVQSWRGMDGAIEGVHLGTDVIASPTSHCYLDYPLSNTDLEEIYSFNPIPEEASHGPGRVIGGECNMWSERAPQHLVESKVFPRAIGLAEVLWSGTDITLAEGAYDRFIKRLDVHVNRLGIIGVDYGLESVPVSMSLTLDEGDDILYANITPAGSYIKGTAKFVTIDGVESESKSFNLPIEITETGEVVATINYRGRVLERTENFPVSYHAGLYKEISLGYEPSQYYTGGGNYALVDGKIGSMDFRDGVWQGKQGEDLRVVIDLSEIIEIDNFSMNFYLYQDAWIFAPRSLKFMVSDNGEEYSKVSVVENEEVFEKDERQTIINFNSGSLKGVSGRYVKVVVENAGPCPYWHAAATEPTWLFVDEIVVNAAD